MPNQLADDEELAGLESGDDVAAAAARIYGSTLTERGLIHAAAVWQGDRGRLVALRPEDAVARCHHAGLAGCLARARADAILTTGAALRRQPTLDHRLGGPGALGGALTAWRHEHLAKPEPPITLVVTPDADLELEHPIFRYWTRPVVLTSPHSQWQLESRAVDFGIEVVGVETPTPRTGVEFLRRAFGAATIALEVDPRALRDLDRPPVEVDEVLLTTARAAKMPADALGPPFLTAEQLLRRFPEQSTPYRVIGAEHEWCCQRFRR